jgi:hypothetical protein
MKLIQYIHRVVSERMDDLNADLVEHYNDKWEPRVGGWSGRIHYCDVSDKYFFQSEGRIVRNGRGRNIFVYADVVDYWECACCSEDFLSDECNAISTQDGSVCESCHDDNYATCQSCGDIAHTDNCDYDEDSCDYTCNHCSQRRTNVIDGYHSRRNESTRDGWRHPSYRNQILFGVELEILATRNQTSLAMISSAAKAQGFLAERDGSLDSNYGVEIIAPPLSIEDCASQWKSFLSSIHGRATGWQAGTGYGMHVSFSRKPLSNLHAGKLLQFVHANQALCEDVAGRSANEWCRYRQKSVLVGAYERIMEKYEALAIRGNYRWEMRIFRSTLKFEGFMRNVEFVKACIDFTKQARAGSTADEFRGWLFLPANRKSYPHLLNHVFDAYRALNVIRLQRHNANQVAKIKI